MSFITFICAIALLLFGLDMVLVMKEIYGGTKYKGKCNEFIDRIDEEGNINERFGCIFTYKDKEGNEQKAYTDDFSSCYADKTYKILVSDADPTHCSRMGDINKSYFTDLIIIIITLIIMVSNIN